MAKLSSFIVFTAVLLCLTAPTRLKAQIQYARGQDVVPAFEGWQRNDDGSISMFFGYMNRNFEEEVDVPIGPNNAVDPGGDQGQPAHFYPRRHRFAFKVVVPKDWDPKRKVVWTLVVRGQTEKANGSLLPTWELDKEVIMENISNGLKPDLESTPPKLTGSGPQAVTLPNSATLTVTAEGNSRPPTGRQGAGAPGVSITWIEFRGPGPVSFDSPTASATYGKSVTAPTSANFTVPGTYWLRAIARDGGLESSHDVTVTVKPAGH